MGCLVLTDLEGVYRSKSEDGAQNGSCRPPGWAGGTPNPLLLELPGPE